LFRVTGDHDDTPEDSQIGDGDRSPDENSSELKLTLVTLKVR